MSREFEILRRAGWARELFDASDTIAPEPRPTVADEPEPAALLPRPDWARDLSEIVGASAAAGARVVGVAAAQKRRGAGRLALDLAQWASERGDGDILVIECNWRSPSLSRFRAAPSGPDLSAALRGEVASEPWSPARRNRLYVLPCGAPPDRAARRRLASTLPELIAAARKRFAGVFCEIPAADDPLLAATPAREALDAVLLAVATRRATPRSIRAARRRLAARGQDPVAVILTTGGGA